MVGARCPFLAGCTAEPILDFGRDPGHICGYSSKTSFSPTFTSRPRPHTLHTLRGWTAYAEDGPHAVENMGPLALDTLRAFPSLDALAAWAQHIWGLRILGGRGCVPSFGTFRDRTRAWDPGCMCGPQQPKWCVHRVGLRAFALT